MRIKLLPSNFPKKLLFTLPALFLTLIATVGFASAGVVVFQDNFDDNDGSVNTGGIGPSLVAQNPSTSGGNVNAVESSGVLNFGTGAAGTGNSTGGGGRDFAINSVGYTLTDGFTLSFDYVASGNQPSQTFSVGLSTDITDADLFGNPANGAGVPQTSGDAIFFSALSRNGLIIPGLIEQTGGLNNTLETFGLSAATSPQTNSGSVSFTVNLI